MDRESGSSRGGSIPRLSRLPLPRPQSNLQGSHHDGLSKSSMLPKLSGRMQMQSRLRQDDKQLLQGRSDIPVRDSAQGESVVSVDRTALDTMSNVEEKNRDPTDLREQTETALEQKRSPEKERRKPRPSLSERTVETLSQIPPSPSPTRKRPSMAIYDANGSMGPPNRPTPAMRTSRPTTPSISRSPSPSKRQFKSEQTSISPRKDLSAVPAPSSFDKINTPSKAPSRALLSAGLQYSRDSISSNSEAVASSGMGTTPLVSRSQPIKVESAHDVNESARQSKSRPSTSFVSTKVPKTLTSSRTIASASPKSKSSQAKTPTPSRKQAPTEVSNPTPKSSATLRETIAQAKAAKKAAQMKQSSIGESDWTDASVSPQFGDVAANPASLKKRIAGAVTSGSLNLSALSLKAFPGELLKMYDFDESDNINWSETVDLTKLLIADNDIENLPDEAFPDWTEEQLFTDPDKSNVLAGLEVLDIHGNQLNAIPLGFRRLGRLSSLNLSKNKLSVGIFDTLCCMSSLKELRLANNEISGVLPETIGELSQLTVLDLRHNQIMELPSALGKLKNLQKLLLADNKLSTISPEVIQTLPLIELDLSKNKLTGSILGHGKFEIPSLQNLDISSNALGEITAKELILPNLETFSVHHNRLRALPELSRCPNLVVLATSENQLAELPSGFLQLQKLRSADLSNNQIKLLDTNLARMESLTAINLGGNPLRDRRYLTMDAGEIKADLEKKLATTNSENNNDLPRSVAEATGFLGSSTNTSAYRYKPNNGVLDLSSKKLSEIDMSLVDLNFGSAQPIHTIRLSNNKLKCLPIELLAHETVNPSLTSLDISHNPGLHTSNYLMSNLHLPVLQHLNMASTGLVSLSPLMKFLSAPKLIGLNISYQRLSGDVPRLRAYFPSLTGLLARDNSFSGLGVEAVQGLEILDVANNDIDSLPPKLGFLGNHRGKVESGRLRSFECSGNRFRVPRIAIVQKGTEAVLRDLRRMSPEAKVPEEWKDEM